MICVVNQTISVFLESTAAAAPLSIFSSHLRLLQIVEPQHLKCWTISTVLLSTKRGEKIYNIIITLLPKTVSNYIGVFIKQSNYNILCVFISNFTNEWLMLLIIERLQTYCKCHRHNRLGLLWQLSLLCIQYPDSPTTMDRYYYRCECKCSPQFFCFCCHQLRFSTNS